MVTRQNRAGRPSGADPEQTRSRLLKAAEKRFSEKGFRRATSGEIAEAAGLSKAMVRYYFGDKAGLYTAVFDRETQAVLDEIEARVEETGAETLTLDTYIGVFSRALLGRTGFPRMLLRDYLDGEIMTRPELVTLLRRFFDRTRALYVKERAEGEVRDIDPHILHLIIVGATSFFSLTRPFRARAMGRGPAEDINDPDIDAFVSHLQSILMTGISTRQG